MFQPWRLKLREAEEAFKGGRLDEAGRLLRQPDLEEFLPARRLLAKVAREMARRGQARTARGESTAGWHDLESAAALGADTEALVELRTRLVERAVAESEGYLLAGEPQTAVARLDALREHAPLTGDCRRLRDAASKAEAARLLARRGQFAEAAEALSSAVALRPDLKQLRERQEAYREAAVQSRRLAEHLHQALKDEDWTMALSTAEELLAMSPEHGLALDARRRAWAAVGAKAAATGPAPRAAQRIVAGHYRPVASGETMHAARNNSLDTPAEADEGGSRFLLWVDGVGGFLVCEGHQLVIGQPVPGSHVDIPILGDLSRQHATIRRDGEGYLIVPHRPVRLSGRSVESVTSLTDGGLIELGEGVRLCFRRPHPLSRTARLEFASSHRTQPSADAIILMAENCILGPGGNSHVQCPNWQSDVVLFQQSGALFCRRNGHFEVDGNRVEGEVPITRSSRISGDDFSVCLELL